MATFTYDLSTPANSAITFTIADNTSAISTNDPDNPSTPGYAITAVNGTFNGATITGLSGTSGAYSGSNNANIIQDNALFAGQNGDNGNYNGIDTNGVSFTASDGNTYNLYFNGQNLSYQSANTQTGAQTANATPTTVVTDNGAPCYCTGTHIRTTRGDVAVEHLAIGDLAVTASGAHRAISWIGSRLTNTRRYSRPQEAMPVRVSAHALGENRPARDLLLSPGHALCIDVVGEVLIPAGSLINGTTITQEDVDSVTYWHVEVEGGHDILLAENMPAESYLEMGNRGFFAGNGVVVLDASPDATVLTHDDFCRPFHAEGALVEVVRAQLAARAGQLGWRLEERGLDDLHLLVDGVRVDPRVRGLSARFTVPAGAQAVWLVSSNTVPAEIAVASADRRSLGVCLAALTIDDGFNAPRGVSLDDPSLCVGFHPAEHDGDAPLRWTAGRARLPASLWEGIDDDTFLRVDLTIPALPRWVAPAAAVAHDEPVQLMA